MLTDLTGSAARSKSCLGFDNTVNWASKIDKRVDVLAAAALALLDS